MSEERLERVLDPTFVDGLDGLSTTELRERRGDAEAEEEAVSYVRRLLQGRLDLLRAELRRREDAGSEAAGTLLAQLSSILADAGVGGRDAVDIRATRLRIPDGVEPHEARLDRVLPQNQLDDLGALPVDELRRYIELLAEHERELSRTRRILFDRIDTLRAELAARYKDGRAAVSDLLTGKSST